jgi:hypothetical protein
LYLHMEASQHSLLAACFTLHSINATLAIVPQRGAGLWMAVMVYKISFLVSRNFTVVSFTDAFIETSVFGSRGC